MLKNIENSIRIHNLDKKVRADLLSAVNSFIKNNKHKHITAEDKTNRK